MAGRRGWRWPPCLGHRGRLVDPLYLGIPAQRARHVPAQRGRQHTGGLPTGRELYLAPTGAAVVGSDQAGDAPAVALKAFAAAGAADRPDVVVGDKHDRTAVEVLADARVGVIPAA